LFSRIVSNRRYILVDCRQRAGVHGHLHRQRFAKDWQPVPGLASDRRPICRGVGNDVRAGKRLAGLLDIRRQVL